MRTIVSFLALLVVVAALGMIVAFIKDKRDMGLRAACIGNLFRLTFVIRDYIQINGQAPDDFASLLSLTNIQGTTWIDDCICPATGHRPGDPEDIDNWTDYTMLSPSSKTGLSNGVLVYCSPQHHANKWGIVATVDKDSSSATSLRPSEFDQAIGETSAHN